MTKAGQGGARYTSQGYKDRDDYLNTLADDRGIDRTTVYMIADILGETEDFDGLVSGLEDFGYTDFFDEGGCLDDETAEETIDRLKRR
jgi:hypothetical protein